MRTITTTIVHKKHQERAVRQEEQMLESVVTQERDRDRDGDRERER